MSQATVCRPKCDRAVGVAQSDEQARAGAEAGSRLLEYITRGSMPAMGGDEPKSKLPLFMRVNGNSAHQPVSSLVHSGTIVRAFLGCCEGLKGNANSLKRGIQASKMRLGGTRIWSLILARSWARKGGRKRRTATWIGASSAGAMGAGTSTKRMAISIATSAGGHSSFGAARSRWM